MSPRSPALTSDWWIERRHQPPFRGALERAFLYHWSERVQTELDSNKQRGRQPDSWEDLSTILFADLPDETPDESELRNLASPIGQLVVAQAVGCELEDLSPSIARWLQTTVANLLDLPVENQDTADYVAYRLRQRKRGTDQAEAPEGPSESVMRIVNRLDEILVAGSS